MHLSVLVGVVASWLLGCGGGRRVVGGWWGGASQRVYEKKEMRKTQHIKTKLEQQTSQFKTTCVDFWISEIKMGSYKCVFHVLGFTFSVCTSWPKAINPKTLNPNPKTLNHKALNPKT